MTVLLLPAVLCRLTILPGWQINGTLCYLVNGKQGILKKGESLKSPARDRHTVSSGQPFLYSCCSLSFAVPIVLVSRRCQRRLGGTSHYLWTGWARVNQYPLQSFVGAELLTEYCVIDVFQILRRVLLPQLLWCVLYHNAA
jgi:hypothetical protein